MAGTSMILASMFRHWPLNMAVPSFVARSTTFVGGKDGAIAGIGFGAGAGVCAIENDATKRAGTAAIAANTAPRMTYRLTMRPSLKLTRDSILAAVEKRALDR